MASVMRGEHGGTVLVHQSFRYHKHRATANGIYWRCWRKDCCARARTNLFDLPTTIRKSEFSSPTHIPTLLTLPQ
ncbi:hypothetical protein ACOMHN_055659 [Nucella lapillus]